MKIILTIIKKEILNFFNSAIAYIFLTIFLTLVSFLFFRVYFLRGVVSLNSFFTLFPWVFLLFVPAVSMKSWAEEKKQGTMEVLLTMPATDFQLVVGKFLAGTIFVSIAILLTLIVPFLVSFTGDLDWGPVFTSYIGSIFLVGAFIAIGNFLSSLTNNQITAFLLTAVISFLFLIVGTPAVYTVFPSFIADIIRNISMSYHFSSIGRGILDSRDVIYYLSVIFLFLFYNVKSLESRNW